MNDGPDPLRRRCGTPSAHPWGSITDVPGIHVGQAERVGDGWLTGVTVVVPPRGTIGSVDVRGGGPATHETDALAPTTLVPTVDAVCLSGGSAYGLAATTGVQRWCEEHGRGYPVGPADDPDSVIVPIVAGASLFDLGRGGDPTARPGPDLGYEAAARAQPSAVVAGRHGVGTGAVCALGSLAGGVGEASIRVRLPSTGLSDEVAVGALVVVNAAGLPFDPRDGSLLGRGFVPPGMPRPGVPHHREAAALGEILSQARQTADRPRAWAGAGENTSLAIVATQAGLDPAGAWRLAACGHDGLARALSPVHTLIDGDAVFALATGEVTVSQADALALQAAAADAVMLATMDAVLAARRLAAPGIEGIDVLGYADVCPSAALRD